MKLQLDTTVSFHRVLNRPEDEIMKLYADLEETAQSVHASTFTKKEFAFSVIRDYCAFQAKLFSTKSLLESYSWIDRYSFFRKRFGQRIHDLVVNWIIEDSREGNLPSTRAGKDRFLAEKLVEYLRVVIPELWDRFECGVTLPLDDRTKCPFAHIGPDLQGHVFTMRKKLRCDGSEGCSLHKMLNGKDVREKAGELLKNLRSFPESDGRMTSELKKIRDFLVRVYIDGQISECFALCNGGIGDAIIVFETIADRTLVTTNALEFEIICGAISQRFCVLRRSNDAIQIS